MPTTQTKAFKDAVADVNKLKTKPEEGELLQLYALYKESLQDPEFDANGKPSVWDMKARAKWSAWEKVHNETDMTAEVAMTRYAALVGELKKKYGVKA